MDQPEFAGMWDPASQQQQPAILRTVGVNQRPIRSKMEEVLSNLRLNFFDL
jgi:hypothetical protein